jgi:serine/threonine-protein kinase
MSATEKGLVAWAATLAEDVTATIKSEPGKTILPAGLSTSGARAMRVLAQLAGRSPGASVQLVHGDVLGEGGMGIVRNAEQVSLGRTVAVKSLKRKDPHAALDLLREAWVTGAIEHPNVVPVHFVDLDADGMPIVVLKRVEGASWSALCNDAAEVARRFGATDLLAWNLGVLTSVLNAIRYAHHRGVIHRDLKPSNVMIGDFGEVYLLDWGIAVALRDDGTGRFPLASGATELAGTPSYMAPEMLGRDGSPPLSERTDVYLAGAVLFELITGNVPHQGNDVITVIASIVGAQPEMPANVPAELARICQRAMAPDPNDRYASAEELRLALQAYLEHRDSTELVARAASRLDELRAMLAADQKPTRDDVYRVFGACRFGFHEALARWHENADAKVALDTAIALVAEYELTTGNPKAALALLADIHAPALLARAHADEAAAATQLAALEDLRHQNDSKIGRRTRTMFAVILGTSFTALPLGNAFHPWLLSPADHAYWSIVALAVFAGLAYWARQSMMATLFNRRLVAAIFLLFVAQVVVGFSCDFAGLTVETTALFYSGMWMILSGMLAIQYDWRLGGATVVYAAMLLVGGRWPSTVYYLMALGNLAFAVAAVIVWRPSSLRPTDEEVERYKIRRFLPRPKTQP